MYSMTAMPKTILLYTGMFGSGNYATYTTSDIDKLLQATNEFTLCNGGTVYNYYNNGNVSTPIITSNVINNIQANDVQFANKLANIKADYQELLSKWNDPNRTLEKAADAQIELAKNIVSRNSNAVIWFSFPHAPASACAQHYKVPFTQFFTRLKEKVGSAIWNNNVRGFYWGTEHVEAYYTKFDASSPSTNYNNRMIELMAAMSSLVKKAGKQFMWMPYTTNEPDNSTAYTFIRAGYVANRTNIFDYVLLQPGYYQKPEKDFRLNSVKTCVQDNKVYDRHGGVIGGSKTSSTKIGVDMEIDDKIAGVNCPAGTTWWDYSARYYEYTLRFDPLKSKIPISYYAGERNSLMNPTVYNYVKTFLTY